MRNYSIPAFFLLAVLVVAGGCASHQRDFIPNGAGLNLEPTNPAHIQVLDSVPRGMVIGTILVDRAKAKNTSEIIETAKEKAAAVGGDFIVWEDSLGTTASATPTPGAAPPDSNTQLAHSAALPVETPPEEMNEKSPKARFTVGIFLPEGHPAAAAQ